MKHDCHTCKYGNEIAIDYKYSSCLKLISSGQANNCPDWEPMTNGDRVRQMTNEELMKLWSTEKFDDKYFPGCAADPEAVDNDRCKWMNYTCELCPLTFYNWLEAEMEDETDEGTPEE